MSQITLYIIYCQLWNMHGELFVNEKHCLNVYVKAYRNINAVAHSYRTQVTNYVPELRPLFI